MDLSLVTWNLDGLEPRHLDVRTEAACLHLLLRPDPPDVVVVQEVVDRTWHAHLRPHFGHAGYAALPGRVPSSYWNAVFVRQPLVVREAHVRPLPSDMGRALLDVRVEHPAGGSLRVLTSHLESLRDGAALRRLQLKEVLNVLLYEPGPAVFAGDTNLRDEEVPHIPGLDQVVDAWEATGRDPATRYTWDTVRIANKAGKRGARMRFDRIYVNQRIQVSDLRLVGDQPLPEADGWHPSDHLGLRAVLTL